MAVMPVRRGAGSKYYSSWSLERYCMFRAIELRKLILLIVLIHVTLLMFQCLISDNNNIKKNPWLPREQTGSKQYFFLPSLLPAKERIVPYSQKRVTEMN